MTSKSNSIELKPKSPETVNVGDIIIISGKLTLDKDFGYGYFYKVIIEEQNGKLFLKDWIVRDEIILETATAVD